MLKLEPQYFGHLMRRADSLEKTPMLGKTEGKRSRGQQRMRLLVSITDSMNMNLSKCLHMVIVAQRTQKKMKLYWSKLAVLLELSQRWSELGFWPEWPGGLCYVGHGVAGERQFTGKGVFLCMLNLRGLIKSSCGNSSQTSVVLRVEAFKPSMQWN